MAISSAGSLAARLDVAAIEVVHVAYVFGELFAGQRDLGAMPASVHEGLWDTPSSRHDLRPLATRPH